MFVKEVTLRHFRNLGCQSVAFCPGVNLIYGKNAQGKTNLLESVFLLSCPKGFRQGRERDYIAFGEAAAKVLLRYQAFGREQTLELSLFSDARKSILLNGVSIRKNGELASQFCTVLFEPGHLDLVKEGPEQRRHFLDTAISQLRPKYQSALESYSRVVAQKNMLLKKKRRLFFRPAGDAGGLERKAGRPWQLYHAAARQLCQEAVGGGSRPPCQAVSREGDALCGVPRLLRRAG